MKTIIKFTLFAVLALLLNISCTADDSSLDTTKPTIELALPSEHQEFEFGDDLNVQAIFKDDVELGSYKIEIHSADDGHEHRSASTGWSFNDIGDISGKKEHLLNKTIPIPTGDYTEGHYHMGIILIDKAGNETQKFIEIVVGDHHDH